jgi:UDPglucose 6-dehydrogenase
VKIAVIGSGYVGLVASACLAELGHNVISVDCDATKVQRLQAGEVPIFEMHLPELIRKHHGTRLTFSTDLIAAVRASQVIFIAVGTPSTEEGTSDLSYVESVAKSIALAVDDYKVVVEKSTVPVLTSQWIRRVMLLNGVPAESFDVVSNPEFLREGTAVVDFMYPDRIVVGADSERAISLLKEIYQPLTSGAYHRNPSIPSPENAAQVSPLLVTSTRSAEVIKHASNAFLATKISFINAVANVCEAVGADVQEVCRGVGADARIGSRFLNPGIGYGGSCFPKDLKAFAAVAREAGCDFKLLEEVMNINSSQKQVFLKKVRSALWTLKGKRIAALGLAFKGGTDDIRESPALELVTTLAKEGCCVRAYDPAAIERARAVIASPAVTYCDSAYEAAENADALLILTDWQEFASLDLPRLRSLLAYPIIIDGRNLYDPNVMRKHGFVYYSVGRADVVPSRPPAEERLLAVSAAAMGSI